MNTTGLPADLPDAARAYLEAFPKGEIVAFPIDPVDRVGIPVWIVALFPEDQPRTRWRHALWRWLWHRRRAGDSGGDGRDRRNGRFPRSRSARGRRPRGSYTDLVANLGAGCVADPLTLCLPAGSPVGRKHAAGMGRGGAPCRWLQPCWCRSTLLPTIRPSCRMGIRRSPPSSRTAWGPGPICDWAVGHGLCEILQRDGNGLLFRALDRGVALDLPDDLSPGRRRTAGEIPRRRVFARFRNSRPTNSASRTSIAWAWTSAANRRNRSWSPLAAKPRIPMRDAALEKALTEYAASRSRKAYAHGDDARTRALSPQAMSIGSCRTSGGAAKSVGSARARCDDRLAIARRRTTLRGWLAPNMLAEKTRKPFADLPHTPCPGPRDRGRIALERVGRCRVRHALCRHVARRMPGRDGEADRARNGGRDDELLPDRRTRSRQADGAGQRTDRLR